MPPMPGGWRPASCWAPLFGYATGATPRRPRKADCMKKREPKAWPFSGQDDLQRRYKFRNNKRGGSMKFAALVLALLATTPAAAEPLLHPMFADHAVLQRDQPIRVYGKANAGTDIRVQLGSASATTRATADGQWTAS